MSQQPPRRPANLPAGTSSLSERIAALQKKNSINGNGSAYNRSSSTSPGIAGVNAASSSAPTHLSPTNSPVRSISAGSQAVKDRIARFQQPDKQPIVPKSSLGTPSPMDTGRSSNAVRAYPGANASGSGSGNWGENVLRPQLTGGTWVGAGEGKGWADAGSVRPQLTGSAWLGVGGSPSPNNSVRLSGLYSGTHRSPIRDAFLDLDDETRLSASPQKRDPVRRGSSFSEAQMAAASKGLSRASSNDGSERGHSPFNERRGSDVHAVLPTLPDTPSKSLPLLTIPGARQVSIDDPNLVSKERTLPSPPTEAPVTIATSPPRDVRTSGDIEIGIGGASPAKMRDLQRTLSGSHDYIINTNTEKVDGPIPTAPILPEVVSSPPPSTTQNVASSDDGAYDIGRLATKSDSDETEAPTSSPISIISPFAKVADLPAITVLRQSQQDESKAVSNGAASKSCENDVVSPSKSIENGAMDSLNLSKEVNQNGSADSDGTLTAANSMKTVTESQSEGEVDTISKAQQKAKEAIQLARSKSQRGKKPPVGRPMTVAEMDASDDEYEPGWASVISTSSNRT